jgi:hypothetical protein
MLKTEFLTKEFLFGKKVLKKMSRLPISWLLYVGGKGGG